MTHENDMAGSQSGDVHPTRVVVWDVPATVVPGEKFTVKLGVKCLSGCEPSGWILEVHDADGERRASAAAGGKPWPGTAGLQFAEVKLRAPESEGLHAWEAKATPDRAHVPHTDALSSFHVRVVPSPECLLTVVAVDAATRRPVDGARVVLHPYEASTDGRGVAEVRLPRGEYRLFVSGKDYFPFRTEVDMSGDLTIRAELALDVELSDADIWS